MKPRQRGLFLALVATVTIGVDPLGARFLGESGAEYWPYSFWRALFYSTFVLVYVAAKAGSASRFASGVRAVGRTLPLLTYLMGQVETLFMYALYNTSIARCLLLFSLNPMWSAILAAIILKERMRRPTVVAVVLSIVSVCIVFVPPLVIGDADVTSTPGGDISAACAGASFALYMVLARRAGQLSEGKADTAAAAAFGGYLATLFALVMSMANGHVLAPPAAMGFRVAERPEWSFWLAIVVQSCGVGVCLICVSVAPKLAPAAEVGIVMLLQLLLSPLWVWLAFGEAPPTWTIAGGLCQVATLAGHEVAMQRLANAPTRGGPTLEATSTSDAGSCEAGDGPAVKER